MKKELFEVFVGDYERMRKLWAKFVVINQAGDGSNSPTHFQFFGRDVFIRFDYITDFSQEMQPFGLITYGIVTKDGKLEDRETIQFDYLGNATTHQGFSLLSSDGQQVHRLTLAKIHAEECRRLMTSIESN